MSQRPQYLSAEDRRAATVQAVVDLAAEQNPAEITTTAIADRMGLTQGALFRHFPTKEAIVEATMSWVGERLLVSVDKAAEGAASPAAALEAMFMTHIDFVSKHPGVPRMLFGELQRSGETLAKRMVQPLIRQERTPRSAVRFARPATTRAHTEPPVRYASTRLDRLPYRREAPFHATTSCFCSEARRRTVDG